MTRTSILLGAVAALTLGAAAHAQSVAAPLNEPAPAPAASDATMPAPAPMDSNAAATMPSASSAAAQGADVSTTASMSSAPVAGSVTVTTLTNGPVPDTKENRAKYGAPMSHAGKVSRAAGN